MEHPNPVSAVGFCDCLSRIQTHDSLSRVAVPPPAPCSPPAVLSCAPSTQQKVAGVRWGT
eukprot:2630873-Rhodomonas_salina.1